ncbi:hypothetical protein [Streptomyces ardesiacus]|uniref:hypothetical protein n=1 Tax=Streptomyces ardesiacus TaxID=285564 RepID=UPI003662D605
MKLRVYYRYGYGKVKKKDFGPMKSNKIQSIAEDVAYQRKNRGNVTFNDDTCKGFSLAAEDIVLMEVIG